MATIYERIAVCSDTTWNALTAPEQAVFDRHFSSWQNWLDYTKADIGGLQLGCYEVIVWNDFGVLPRYSMDSSNYLNDDVDNFIIYRAHSSARHNGSIGSGIKMNGVNYIYLNYVLFDGFEFDQNDYGDPSYSYFVYCNNNTFYFENCIFSNIMTMYYSLNLGYYKNCLFYQLGGYIRNQVDSVLMLNCGIYTTNTASTNGTLISNAECYNCWTYSEGRDSNPQFGSACTGDNNYAQDGSGPIAVRTLATFGFTDAANGDFSITPSSPLFDRGSQTSDDLDADIAGGARVANSAIDIGPFEIQGTDSTITISAPSSLVGAEVRIYDLDDTPAGTLGTELAGVESCTTSTYQFTQPAGNVVWIQIMLAGYEEYGQQYTVPANNSDYYALMTADRNA